MIEEKKYCLYRPQKHVFREHKGYSNTGVPNHQASDWYSAVQKEYNLKMLWFYFYFDFYSLQGVSF